MTIPSSLVSRSVRHLLRPTAAAFATSYYNNRRSTTVFGYHAQTAPPSTSSTSPIIKSCSTLTRRLSTQPTRRDDPSSSSTVSLALRSLPDLSPRILAKLQSRKRRHDEISALLQHGGGDGADSNSNSGQEVTSLGKELSSLSLVSTLVDRVVEIYDESVALSELQSEARGE